MADEFNEYQSWSMRALQIYQILIGQAHNRQRRTYQEIGQMVGISAPINVRHALAPISYWCYENRLPHLTSIVVKQGTDEPGVEMPGDNRDFNTIQEEVFNKDWYAIVPPTAEAMERASQQH